MSDKHFDQSYRGGSTCDSVGNVGRRVAVTGSRNATTSSVFVPFSLVEKWLNHYRPSHVIHGGANGVDNWAHMWALANKIPFTIYHAQWKQYGPAAGPLRNQEMLTEGRPDLLLSFLGDKGTADCVRRAERIGIKVVRAERDFDAV